MVHPAAGAADPAQRVVLRATEVRLPAPVPSKIDLALEDCLYWNTKWCSDNLRRQTAEQKLVAEKANQMLCIAPQKDAASVTSKLNGSK